MLGHAELRARAEECHQQHADEYWIVDLDARIIERWRPDDGQPEMCDMRFEWLPAGAAAPMTLDVAAFFREVLDT